MFRVGALGAGGAGTPRGRDKARAECMWHLSLGFSSMKSSITAGLHQPKPLPARRGPRVHVWPSAGTGAPLTSSWQLARETPSTKAPFILLHGLSDPSMTRKGVSSAGDTTVLP